MAEIDQAYVEAEKNWMANQKLCIQTCENIIDYRKKEIAILNEQLTLDTRQLELERERLSKEQKILSEYMANFNQ